MNVLKKIKPVLVLSVICTLICALLIVTYNLTYVDTSGVLTDNLKAGCIAADGEGEYALITDKAAAKLDGEEFDNICLLYTSPSPRDNDVSRMPSSA